MAAKPKQNFSDESPAPKAAVNPLILSQSEHARLSDKEKRDFRAKGGTVSNQ